MNLDRITNLITGVENKTEADWERAGPYGMGYPRGVEDGRRPPALRRLRRVRQGGLG
jgi:hypothetical protein